MQKKNKKLIIIIGIVIILVLGGIIIPYLFKSKQEGGLEYTEIKRGDIENIVSSTGALSAVETVEVGSQVSGILEQILVDFNSQVKKGQVLAILDKAPFEITVQDAEAGVMRAKAKLNQADVEVKRNQPLTEKGHLSEMEFLTIKTSFETAKADLTTAEAILKKARTNLGYTVIRSPIDGTVIERAVDPGQTIAASFQAPKLFIIAQDLTRMQIEVNVDESDIGQIKVNQNVRFTVQAYPDDVFTGTVRQVRLQPTTIQNVVNYIVVVDAANEKGTLLPGMTATVDFLVEEKKNVLLVPNSAINFQLPEEFMAKNRTVMMEKMKKMFASRQNPGGSREGAGNSGSTGMATGNMMTGGMNFNNNMPKDLARVFFLDTDGLPMMAMFKKGASDGKMTELIFSSVLKEGMKVLTAYKIKTDEQANSQPRGSLFMPPRMGGPR